MVLSQICCYASPEQWTNFLERVDCKTEEELKASEELEEELRLWAAYRGQTLTRTGIVSSQLQQQC